MVTEICLSCYDFNPEDCSILAGCLKQLQGLKVFILTDSHLPYNSFSLECPQLTTFILDRTEVLEKATPLVYTYFKRKAVPMDLLPINHIKELDEFKERLKESGHFPTWFTYTNDLHFQFNSQLTKSIPIRLRSRDRK